MFANADSPPLCWNWQLANWLHTTEAHPNWSMYADLWPVSSWLASPRPICSNITLVNITAQQKEDWSLASAVNHASHTLQSSVSTYGNLSHTVSAKSFPNGSMLKSLHIWGLDRSGVCECGPQQTMNYVVDKWPVTKFEGSLSLLHEVKNNTAGWQLHHS